MIRETTTTIDLEITFSLAIDADGIIPMSAWATINGEDIDFEQYAELWDSIGDDGQREIVREIMEEELDHADQFVTLRRERRIFTDKHRRGLN